VVPNYLMVHHVIKTIKNKKYNYLVHTIKEDGKFKKISKYLGPGKIPKNKINELIKEYKPFFEERIKLLKGQIALTKYKSNFLTEEQIKWVQRLRDHYITYFEPFSDLEKENYEEYFNVRYVYNSTSIEGNTLTLGETGLVIKEGLVPEGKSAKEVAEVINLKNCMEFRKDYQGDINEEFIRELNRMILAGLSNEAGKYKERQNYIVGTEFIPSPPLTTPLEIKGLVNWYNKEKKKRHILDLACIFHQKFVMIHPFVDGNGRTARELFNFILAKKRFPELIFPVKDRKNYFNMLEEGNKKKYGPFIDFSFKHLKEQYKNIFKNLAGLENWM
jgi:Fic family protein